jgi:hypothetical protein
VSGIQEIKQGIRGCGRHAAPAAVIISGGFGPAYENQAQCNSGFIVRACAGKQSSEDIVEHSRVWRHEPWGTKAKYLRIPLKLAGSSDV